MERASVGFNQVGSALVDLRFDADGGAKFAEITKKVAARKCDRGEQKNSLCRIGIKVGEKWITTPTVSQEIVGRNAQISGNFTYESAKNLADGLNLGAIDAPVILSGELKINPSLGATQFKQSLRAAFFGILTIIFFMILIYRGAGIVATIALGIYGTSFLAILKIWPESFGGPIVVTLAGVAGIILSIGLAVDGNILIFERIKEEIKNGREIFSAIDAGFARAWPAIRDSNLTTLLTCFILFSVGSSIIRGFAITLIVGTILSMFTAVTISRNLIRFFCFFDIFRKKWFFGISEKKSCGKN